jgi:hypothetical protein
LSNIIQVNFQVTCWFWLVKQLKYSELRRCRPVQAGFYQELISWISYLVKKYKMKLNN